MYSLPPQTGRANPADPRWKIFLGTRKSCHPGAGTREGRAEAWRENALETGEGRGDLAPLVPLRGGAQGCVGGGTQGWREPSPRGNLTLMRSCPPYPRTVATLSGLVSAKTCPRLWGQGQPASQGRGVGSTGVQSRRGAKDGDKRSGCPPVMTSTT